ncbi:hypothetical protein RE428_16390 [Marinobacter nanhaiticus D15-8W]|uniref:Uncharacterized protein n=1 Tax=Marinobacter nanhaiticus D15-8W TaxID=626887 RepID=N6WQE7_9GAMM|nr:hypothetical protein [Marinobacter nanhaiticus]ENO13257.1 hypothetical protein J057_17715 [Marinobacter nanhaiticus D15-8W]BES70621.1 hypothetical protein RE428_16390 [Marinobacter nanhaiticus D15-8W]
MTDNADQRPPDDHWWLSPGGEYCPFCSGSWHAEALAYCMACDRPVCHICVAETVESDDLLCPECAAEQGSDPDGSEAGKAEGR